MFKSVTLRPFVTTYPYKTNMQPILSIAINAARNASKILLRSLGQISPQNVTEKQRNDFVTEVDKQSEKKIIETIQKSYPDHKIIAEESGLIDGDDTFTWIIDPLDGTTNFIHGIPHFCISIALRYKGRIEHGVIYDPIRNELFTASRGEGARLNERRLRVTTNVSLEKSMIGTGFPFRNLENITTYMRAFGSIMPKVCGVRRAGSAALDLAYVASGRFDGFWEMGLSEWDIAAGSLMVKEAGGLVSDTLGEENYLETGNVIAGNPKIFKALLQIIRPLMLQKNS